MIIHIYTSAEQITVQPHVTMIPVTAKSELNNKLHSTDVAVVECCWHWLLKVGAASGQVLWNVAAASGQVLWKERERGRERERERDLLI